ncbi:MAG: hypothetical protein HXY20_03600 [Acidobacteria bacterium]|nr:hypothetical protein [Acidobacteriota bacterium]
MMKGMVASLAAVAWISLAAFSASTDVSGTWDLTVESEQSTANPSLTLVQSGEQLSGTYRGRMGQYRIEGTIRGNDIRFSVTVRFQDQPVVVIYSGTVDTDSMSGTVQFGDYGSGTWTAKRRST